jgi:hypothetical protein
MDPSAIQAARDELSTTSKQDIERDTAYKWGARAIAAYQLFTATRDLHWLSDAIAYHGEAVEHGAHANHEVLALMELDLEDAQRLAFSHAFSLLAPPW